MYHAAIPVFLFLGSGYTQYGYEEALILSSKYAQLLFANLAKYRGIGVWRVSLKNLRRTVGAMERSYDNYSTLRQRVIDLSLEQINEHTSLDLSYKPMMKGRATVGIEFSIRPKTPPEDQGKEEKKVEMNQRLETMFQSDIADLVSYASNQLCLF